MMSVNNITENQKKNITKYGEKCGEIMIILEPPAGVCP
jgi:hypothetical protein